MRRHGGAALDGVGPGTLLGGRYVLRQPLGAPVPRGEGPVPWQAHDRTLERLVVLTAVAGRHPHVDAVLDAARRAAAVEEPRLLRVLDVGRDDIVAFVVTEWVTGRTLSDHLRGGPLDAEHVRAVVGEVALALEGARRRGLHHLALTPDDVHEGADGSVRLGGLAVRAALAGIDDGALRPQDASALDAESTVALLYAGLSGYWPLDTRTPLPSAPRVAGRPATPAEIVSGVPADLDALCARTFAGTGGPGTPGEVAAQIAPWGAGRRPVRRSATRAEVGTSRPERGPEADTTPIVIPAPPPAPDATRVLQLPPDEALPVSTPTSTPTSTATAARARVGALTAGLSGLGGTVGAAARKVEINVGRGVDRGVERVTQAGRAVQQRRTAPGGASTSGSTRAPLAALSRTLDGDLARPVPLLPPASMSRPPQSQTRAVLALVSAFVAVVLLLGYCGLRGLGGTAESRSTPTVTDVRPSSTSTPTASPSPSPTPTGAGPLDIAAVTGFDPEGDGTEKDASAERAVDGDPDTSWTSETYRSREFGGLKDGVGLLVDLGRPVPVHSVAVVVGGRGGATVELRSSSTRRLKDSSVLARAEHVDGPVTLTPDATATTRYLMLWFTRIAPSGGGYRAVVDELVVS